MCLGIPCRIVDLNETAGVRMARVDFGGVMKEVCLEHVPDAAAGDYVIVHVGFALTRVDEAEAARIFQLLDDISRADEIEVTQNREKGAILA